VVLGASVRLGSVVGAALGVTLGLAAACSSGSPAAPGLPDAAAPDGSGCVPFVPPATFNPAAPVVSFMNDVQPIFQASCSLSSSCHNSTNTSPAGLYLGAQGALVYANLVGVPSTELPTMVRVKPGDPAASFLLHRVDGDACTLPDCTTTVCSELMPQGGPPLDEAKLLTLRAWIAQGAISDLPDAGSPEDAGPGAEAGAPDAASRDASPDASDAAGD
jgi:hypothetical protein